jgi:hypothetical protein
LALLNKILRGHPKKNDKTKIKWTQEQKMDFESAQNALTNYTMLHYPRKDAELMFSSSACFRFTGFGAVG